MKTITQIIDEVKFQICDGYCKFPEKVAAEHPNEPDWMIDNDDSPCVSCPLNKL